MHQLSPGGDPINPEPVVTLVTGTGVLSTKSLLLASKRSGADLFLLDWGSKRSDNNNSKERFDLSVLPLMGPFAGCRYQTPTTAFKFKLLLSLWTWSP